MAKTFKQFYQSKDAKLAEIQAKAADEKNQKKAERYFKDVEDTPSIVEAEDVPLDEETYKKYLANK